MSWTCYIWGISFRSPPLGKEKPKSNNFWLSLDLCCMVHHHQAGASSLFWDRFGVWQGKIDCTLGNTAWENSPSQRWDKPVCVRVLALTSKLHFNLVSHRLRPTETFWERTPQSLLPSRKDVSQVSVPFHHTVWNDERRVKHVRQKCSKLVSWVEGHTAFLLLL